MLSNTHIPRIAHVNPHARGLKPTVNEPKIRVKSPIIAKVALKIITTRPAIIIYPRKNMMQIKNPINPDLPTAPIACGIVFGALSQSSHATQRPKYISSKNLFSFHQTLYGSGNLE